MVDLCEFMAEYSNFIPARYAKKIKYICYKASIGIDLLLTTPAHLPQEISSAALSDTPCKAKFSLRLSRPIVARSCLPPVDEESSRSFWVLGSRRRISTHF